MDRQIAEKAIKALAALKSSPRGAHTGTQPSALTREAQSEETGGLCRSPCCGGCYDVGDGRDSPSEMWRRLLSEDARSFIDKCVVKRPNRKVGVLAIASALSPLAMPSSAGANTRMRLHQKRSRA